MPVAVDRNAAIMKIPGTMNLGGIIASPRFAVDDTPPIAPATEEKAPAKRNIMSIVIIFSSPAPLANSLKLLSIPVL